MDWYTSTLATSDPYDRPAKIAFHHQHLKQDTSKSTTLSISTCTPHIHGTGIRSQGSELKLSCSFDSSTTITTKQHLSSRLTSTMHSSQATYILEIGCSHGNRQWSSGVASCGRLPCHQHRMAPALGACQLLLSVLGAVMGAGIKLQDGR